MIFFFKKLQKRESQDHILTHTVFLVTMYNVMST